MTDLNVEQSIRTLVAKVATEEVRRALADALKPDVYLTPKAAAVIASVSPGTVRAWVRQGKLKRHGQGKRLLRVSRNELDRLLEMGSSASNDELSVAELAAKRFG